MADTLLLGDWTGQVTDGSRSAAMRFTIRKTFVTWAGDVRAEGWWWSATDGSNGLLGGLVNVPFASFEFREVGCYGTVTAKVADNRMQGTYTGGTSCPRPMKSGTIDLTRTCAGPAC